MSILMPHSAFLHFPKTGGMWVADAIHNSGIEHKQLKCKNPAHPTQRSIHGVPLHIPAFRAREHVLCFVRHPLHFYRSYWAFKELNFEGPKWNERNPFDIECQANTFLGFMDHLWDHYGGQGYMSREFIRYEHHATYVGKQEHLVDDLVEFLYQAEEEFSEDDIRATPPTNVAASRPDKEVLTLYDTRTIDRVMQMDRYLIDKYYAGRACKVLCV